MYQNIELFYERYKDILLSTENGKSLKPCKSIVKDVENCFNNFIDYWKKGNVVVTKDSVPTIIGSSVDENTRNQNIRVMQEFGFLQAKDGGNQYIFTEDFIGICNSSQPLGVVVLDALCNIRGIESLTMYLNFLLCSLREAYKYGEVILFPDSAEKFKARVENKELRDLYRDRVFKMYGFIGDTRRSKPHLTTDEYTPNMSYMSRTELENLGLLVKGQKKDNLDTLVLTTFGHYLLQQIDKNLSIIPINMDLTPVILYGPPGTGKTYKMQTDYIPEYDKEDRFVTTFHQAFSYEEFVEGLKPVMNSDNIKYVIEEGVFKKACERAATLAGFVNLQKCIGASFEERNIAFSDAINKGKNVLLCIDEINRGNVAAIFGDLISLIESNKRLGVDKDSEMVVKLPYSKEDFGVPANLKIVGTMNTADRSIQLLDTALRRRFKFEELLPKYDVIKNEYAKTILENINARIKCLLNKDNQIGHAYFVHAKSTKDILSAMVNKVIPLLEEYFYNDVEKIRFVLNEDEKTENTFYVEDAETKAAYNIYNKDGIDDEDKNFYCLNKDLIELLKKEDKIENEDEFIKYLPKYQ